jgi:hypothetical protein
MNYTAPISVIIGYFFVLSLSLITTTHVIRNRKKYGTPFMGLLIAAIAFLLGCAHATFYMLSIVFFISDQINIILLKFSILVWCNTLIITSLLFSSFREYKKLKSFPFLIYTILLGLLIGAFLSFDSIALTLSIPFPPPSIIFIDPSLIRYDYNLVTSIILVFFQLLVIFHFFYIALKIYTRTSKKEETLPLFLNTIVISLPIILNLFFIIFHQTPLRDLFIRDLFIIVLWISFLGVCVMIIKKPEIFYVLPNRIYSINIFHKSGILLFSYEFRKQRYSKAESAVWGSILIGLNHILSEFIDKKDKINVIQTKDADVVVQYEEDSGYALIVITNRKNSIVEGLMEKFSIEFKKKYKENLNEIQDINKIINVSEFSDLKELVEKNFELYL